MVAAFAQPIYVTRPILPDLSALDQKLREIWQAQWLTNGGAQHALLEERLRERFDVPHVTLYNNGTSALMAAIHCLGLSGEVITTPFTFVATTHALALSGVTPVFCDIDERTMNLDPARIEAAITPRTTAIMPVHVYGLPCDVEAIGAIAVRHRLKVIYDAAHAFGSSVAGRDIAGFGDATMFSFHATKTFHTLEGGALAFSDPALKRATERYKNFGLDGEEEAVLGLNAKLNEVQAAVGLTVLDCLDEEVARRHDVIRLYRRFLADVEGLTLPPDPPGVGVNPAYFAVRIDARRFGSSRDDVDRFLRRHNVFARKYFYPLSSEFAPYRDLPSAAPDNLPVATRVAREVLALPLYGALEPEQVETICRLLLQARPQRRRSGIDGRGRKGALAVLEASGSRA